jgi:hypothetical protein
LDIWRGGRECSVDGRVVEGPDSVGFGGREECEGEVQGGLSNKRRKLVRDLGVNVHCKMGRERAGDGLKLKYLNEMSQVEM